MTKYERYLLGAVTEYYITHGLVMYVDVDPDPWSVYQVDTYGIQWEYPHPYTLTNHILLCIGKRYEKA